MHLAKRPILTEAETGLVGNWNMRNVGGSILDGSGNANHGTLVADTTTGKVPLTRKDSLLGDCLDFYDDGSIGNGYITVSDSVSLQLDTAITIMAWVYFTEVTGEEFYVNQTIISKQDVGVSGFYFANSNQNLAFRLTGVDTAYSTGNVLQPKVWQHVAVTYDSTLEEGNTKFYVNGDLITENDFNEGLFVNDLDLLIGNSLSDPRFLGMMANPRIYNRAVTSVEIENIYRDTALAIQYMTNWDTEVSPSDRGTAGDDLEQSRWIIISGTWRITTDTINGNTVKVFTVIPTGADEAKLAIPVSWFKKNSPREASFGAFRFWQKKNDHDNILIAFISDGPYAVPGVADGFGIYSDFNGDTSLIQLNPGITLFGPVSTTNGVWHELAAIRYSQHNGSGGNDEFELFVDGSSVGTGGSGTLVEDNKYMVISVEHQPNGGGGIRSGNMIALGNIRGDYGIVKRFGNILR